MLLLQKLADLKEAARQAALARDEFVMPEGLSRKEQRTLLARHKRVRTGLESRVLRFCLQRKEQRTLWPSTSGCARHLH
jgi:hypothetical protein